MVTPPKKKKRQYDGGYEITDQQLVRPGELGQLRACLWRVPALGPFLEHAGVNQGFCTGNRSAVDPDLVPYDIPGRLDSPEGLKEPVSGTNPLGFVRERSPVDPLQSCQKLICGRHFF